MNGQRIGFIGRVDTSGTLVDGQTVKTRSCYAALVGLYGESRILLADTTDYVHRPLRTAASVALCIVRAKKIFVSLSRNGRRFLFPLLYLVARLLGREVYHCLIGGWLASDVRANPRIVKYLNSFQVNWVESHQLASDLVELGVENARFLQNFKRLQPVSSTKLSGSVTQIPIRLCVFSRVQERKGVSDAIHAVAELNSEGPVRVLLDVYGPIDEDYRKVLEALLESNSSVRYRGKVDPEESVSILAGYDGLLFPTKYYEEGIPGTILDAFFAGLPIVASRWKYHAELLEDGITGLSYEFGHNERLAPTVKELFFSNFDLQYIRSRCVEMSRMYTELEWQRVVRVEMGD